MYLRDGGVDYVVELWLNVSLGRIGGSLRQHLVSRSVQS